MAKAETNDQRNERKHQPTIEPIAMRVPEACRSRDRAQHPVCADW